MQNKKSGYMNENYAVTALVPMKGHSERVPSKNVRRLGGKPHLFHILDSLASAKLVYEIIVEKLSV